MTIVHDYSHHIIYIPITTDYITPFLYSGIQMEIKKDKLKDFIKK